MPLGALTRERRKGVRAALLKKGSPGEIEEGPKRQRRQEHSRAEQQEPAKRTGKRVGWV